MSLCLDDYEGSIVLLSGEGLRKAPHQPNFSRPRTPSPVQSFRIERARYARLEDAFRLNLQRLIRSYIGGSISRRDLVKQFSSDLHRYQTVAYDLGRRAAGYTEGRLTSAENRYLHGQHAMEMRYFHNFIRDVDSDRGRMKYVQRMDLYGLSGWSIYLQGVVEKFPLTTRWLWKIKPGGEHCEDCLRRQALSARRGGFTVQELKRIGLPGVRTKCGDRCTCSVEPADYNLPLRRTRPVTFSHIDQYGNRQETTDQRTVANRTQESTAPRR